MCCLPCPVENRQREGNESDILRESEAAIQFVVLRPQKLPNLHNRSFESVI